MARIQEAMNKEDRFLGPSELNGCSLRVIDQSQNFVGTIKQMWATLRFCFRSMAFTVVDIFC